MSAGASTLPAPLQEQLRAGDVTDEALSLAGELGSFAPALADPERQAWELLVVASLEAQRRGDTRLALHDQTLPTLLAAMGVPPPAAQATVALAAQLNQVIALQPLVGAGDDYKPFILDGGFLYQQRVRAIEVRLARTLRARLDRPLFVVEAAALEAALGATPPLTDAAGALSDEQRAAVRAALRQPLTVISGGPGTGKTSVILALLRAATALGLAPEEIAVAAPTGKAAHRINESLAARLPGTAAPAAQTLHRLLGYQSAAGSFRHHRNHPLPHRLVVVDESSMIDLALMERLAGAVRDDGRLVLLGDADQLPSVDAGAVFRDLAPRALTLTRSYRMDPATSAGRAILEAAQAIRTDRPADLGITEHARARALAFQGIEQLVTGPGPGQRGGLLLEEFLDTWHARARGAPADSDRLLRRAYRFAAGAPHPEDLADLRAVFAQQHRQRILCVTRSGARRTGAAAINAALHDRAVADRAAGWTPAFVPGEPLIMSRNDYDRGLFNGDLGLCLLRAAAPARPATFDPSSTWPALDAVFQRGETFVAFPLHSLRGDLELAHALTVHRSQGSELDAIALILPDDDLPLLSRELLYTAITRARRSAVIVGSGAILRHGINRRLQRATGLAERLG